MVNNYEQIKSLLDFSIEDTFYFLQIFKRKKENPDMKSDNIIIDNVFIKSIEDLEKKFPRIKVTCEAHNARAYIRLNRCFYNEVAMETLSVVVEYLQKKNQRNVKSAYTTACGRRCYDPEKKWIIDIDETELHLKDEIKDFVNTQRSGFDTNVIAEIPTKTGVHLLTHPFDLREYGEKYDTDIHKNNPVILYIP